MNLFRKTFAITLLLILAMVQLGLTDSKAEGINDSVADYIKKNDAEEKNPVDEAETEDKLVQSKPVGIGMGEVINMVGALLFVVFLLYVLLRFINKKSQSYQQNRLVQNFGGTSLGGNRSVQMVKVGKQVLILGVGEDIRLLKEITDEEELQDYIRQYNEQLDQSLQPTDMITKWWKAYKQKTALIKEENQTMPFHLHLKEKLDEIKVERKKALNKLGEKEQQSDE